MFHDGGLQLLENNTERELIYVEVKEAELVYCCVKRSVIEGWKEINKNGQMASWIDR